MFFLLILSLALLPLDILLFDHFAMPPPGFFGSFIATLCCLLATERVLSCPRS